MAAGTGPAERHIRIDATLAALSGGFLDFKTKKDESGADANLFNLTQQGIILLTNSVDPTLTTAEVEGALWSDPPDFVDTWKLTLNFVHPLRFRTIRNVSASGIIIVGF